MKNITSFFIFCFVLPLFGVENEDNTPIYRYLSLIHEGEFLFYNKKYYEARSCFERAFEIQKPINYQEVGEFEKYVRIDFLLAQVSKKTFKNIKLLIHNYGYSIDFFEDDSEYDKKIHPKEWHFIRSKYNQWRAEYLSRIQTNLRNKIDSMRQLDQKYRKIGFNTENASAQKNIDYSNLNLIINVFEKQGYPNEKIIGLYNIDNKPVNVEILLLHSPDSIRLNYLLPKIRTFVSNGTCYPEIYARLIDQYLIYNGKNQIYGTITNGNRQLIMIDSPSKVDSARATLGLLAFKKKMQLDSLKLSLM